MKYIIFIRKAFLKFLITFVLLSFPVFVFSQTAHYIGTEKNVNSSFLIERAERVNFGKNVAAKIYKDVKNTYYAVDLKRITSRYVKIRLLEYSYQDNALTNILSNINGDYLLFLVNNKLNKSSKNIILLIEKYKTEASNEEDKMSNAEKTLWLQKHDKYSLKR